MSTWKWSWNGVGEFWSWRGNWGLKQLPISDIEGFNNIEWLHFFHCLEEKLLICPKIQKPPMFVVIIYIIYNNIYIYIIPLHPHQISMGSSFQIPSTTAALQEKRVVVPPQRPFIWCDELLRSCANATEYSLPVADRRSLRPWWMRCILRFGGTKSHVI